MHAGPVADFTKYSDGIGITNENFAGAIMKKIIFSALVISSSFAFTNAAVYAAQNDDVLDRVESLEKGNATIKKENAARRKNKALREQKAALRSTSKQAGAVESAPALSRKRTGDSAKEMPAMDVSHFDLGMPRPTYPSGWSGPYGDGEYPGY